MAACRRSIVRQFSGTKDIAASLAIDLDRLQAGAQ
jgi:hypothetical protein